MSWPSVNHPRVVQLARLAEVFEVWTGHEMPFAKFKIKILERSAGGFVAVPNVAIRNPQTGEPEWVSGLGATVEDALNDALAFIFVEVEQYSGGRRLSSEDFVWAAAEDF